jgi:hypothetical protein
VDLEIAEGAFKDASVMLTRTRVSDAGLRPIGTYLFSKLLASPATTLVLPSSFDFKTKTVSSSSHVGSLNDLSSVTRLVCWVATSKMRISDFFAWSAKLYVETL